MTTLYEGAFAKINLTLDVLDKREDGYHNLKSVMQTISMRDDVEIDVDTGCPWKLTCTMEGVPTDSKNTAWRAAEAFFAATGKTTDGIEIRINKRIPTESGLGGGSADAAAVLRALNRHYGEPLSIFALAEVGAQVGSDVPFCVVGGTCVVEGRGERLRKLPDMPDCCFVICKPDFVCSTPALYRKLDERTIGKRPDHQAMESAILAGDLLKLSQNIHNVFDPVVTEDYLELNYIKSIFNTYGAIGQQLTGSGSAVFAVVPDFERCAVICSMLRENYPNIYIAKPV